ncbi:ATP-dependent Clp protease proteolytic subunit [Clostridium butyricum]|uniref:ATP-dependent Clp protease proteolytic subunit n=1 Tax=Clostridium butyricum TaxID=1492 RepID=UPI00232D7A5A|nr:ATP-dependent Clp protease proteolytic subunit [Clostridium butyricum]MDB2161273.1 ATP-dependent Clp protease proteolytic subunit [Clostridium butyricum]
MNIMEMEQVSANQGRIYLNGVVNEEMAVAVSYYANKIIENNKSYDSLGMKDKKIKTVTLLINSYGGSVIHGNAIIGNIKRLQKHKIKVIGVVESIAYSMAFDIIIHCDERIGYGLSQYLLHQTSFGQGGELKEFEREVEFQKKLWEKSADYYAKLTKIPRERINEIYDRKENFFFDAETALELGVIDKIMC